MKSTSIGFVTRMQHWMDSVPGQTFLNYAYSWGAAIVILGTLFKLTHITGADVMLFIGMGTEVVVFFLSAFDRPFDKGEEVRELSEELLTDEEISQKIAGGGSGVVGGLVLGGGSGVAVEGGTAVGGGGGGTVIIGGGGSYVGGTAASGEQPAEGLEGIAAGVIAPENISAEIVQGTVEGLEQATKDYTEKLKLLTETLDKVEKQSARLTTDSEEMANLNRTLTGINTVYELQLKSISTQVGSIDRINEQTRHMAELIEELNGIYARMIKAMTVNMKNAAGANA